MRFLADMGVARSVALWLRREGHDAIHLLDEGLARASDEEVFKKARAERRALLTFDLDFGEIVASSRPASTTVILFRLRNASSANVRARLSRVLSEFGAELPTEAVIVVEETRIRVRQMPLQR